MKKKSMSVREMRRLLGLGKTEAYWLVKKNYFDTVIIAGKMRVMIESFENWYANQLHYKKIIGEAPGKNWTSITMSIQETASLLGIAEGTLYEMCIRDREGIRLKIANRLMKAPLGEVMGRRIGYLKNIIMDKVEDLEPPLALSLIHISFLQF